MATGDEYRQILADEVQADPLARGYAGMTAEQIDASLRVADRTRFRTAIPNHEVFRALDLGEVEALSQGKRDALQMVMTLDQIDATDPNVRTILGTLFPAGSTTRDNLIALAQETVSRAEEIGIPLDWLTVGRCEAAMGA